MVLSLRPFRSLILFYLSCILAIIVLCADFDFAVASELKLYVSLCLYGGEGMLLCSPLWILRGRWRAIVPAIVCVLSLFLYANVLYYRYWGDLLPWSLIVEPASYNALVFDSVPGLVAWGDIVFFVLPVAIIFLYRRLKVSQAAKLSFRCQVLTIAIAVLAYCAGMCASVISTLRYYKVKNEESSFAKVVNEKLSTYSNSHVFEWHGNGVLLYSYIQLARDRNKIDRLSDEQAQLVARCLDNLEQYVHTDSVFLANKGKNLIFIVVESLNSWAVGSEVNGHKLTPTLDSLLTSEGTISCLDVVPQRRFGGSSDGHFIYNVGLLPIAHGSAAMLFADNDYSELSLAGRFKSSCDFIVENGSVWNHRATSSAYGYDNLVEQIDVSKCAIDRALFELVADTIIHMRQPFLAEVITLGMHYPFEDNNLQVPQWLSDAELDDKHQHNYLKTLWGFDSALGSFIADLKHSGMYDNTVLVLASDHDLDVGKRKSDGRITFVAANTGRTERIDRPVGQIDIFPTVVEIMDLEGWRGLGMSMLDSRNCSSVLADGSKRGASDADIDSLKQTIWPVSDLIVRSDYFRKAE